MVMPYSVPAVFGTVRRSNEPVIPVERYAMYPYVYDDLYGYLNNGAGKAKKARMSRPAYADLPASMPAAARASLLAALEAADAWLAQCHAIEETLSALLLRRSSVFAKRSVIADGEVIGRAGNEAPIGPFTLHVASVARPQRNIGFDVMPFAPSVIPPGIHRVNFSGSFGERLLTIPVQHGASNIAVLRKLRDAVNAGELGVIAGLETEPQSGIVRLELRAEHPGTEHAFNLEDAGGSSLVGSSGIGRVASAASNAVYAVDQEAFESASTNEITLLNNQIMLDLTFADRAAAIAVRVVPDLSFASEQLRALVEGVNTLRAVHGQARGGLEPSFMRSIEAAIAHGGALTAGLRRIADGSWQLDEGQLLAAASTQFEELQLQLTGRSGFAAAFAEELRRMTSLPTEALINVKASAFRPFARYGASSELYLQVRLSGFHVNGVL
ncbi:hypothetical protein GXP70_24795 [Paenibacillus lycopersici]|uniref:Uncharacterized protein n=1 Tax=Paenibacillus lycopersici TaxID=2704462 RepID=A0A6C0G0G7_9BACL|nr:hypothetical protein [Paenibacillus lycopersici]QHT62876.1 hypothetical protein GXP70_24795 [Paenibacillus lycopersici]